MALPGSMYVYQGEELGLPEVEDIPDHLRRDPMWHRSGGVDPGRDGCRVPIPWSGAEPPYGFSHAGVVPWLEQPADWKPFSVEAQDGDPDSMLTLYRRGLRLRREAPWGSATELQWASHAGVLAFARGPRFVCLTNFGAVPVPLPAGVELLLSSHELEQGAIPQDTTAWLLRAEDNPQGPGKEGR